MQQNAPDPFSSYRPGPYFCELTTDRAGDCGVPAAVRARIGAIGLDALRARAAAAEHDLINLGITFTVYSDANAIDRILPFDCIPRILTAAEWRVLEAGVKQRVAALNFFLHDIYHDRRIVKEGVIPADLVFGNPNYRPEMEEFPVRFGTYVHICGTDIVRDREGRFLVLEDNARTRWTITACACWRRWWKSRRRGWTTRRSCCSARASTIRPISSTCSWRAKWACRSSKGPTCSSSTTRCG
jgi:hypothetical protein